MPPVIQPDWDREKIIKGKRQPSKYLLANFRKYQIIQKKNPFLYFIVRKIYMLKYMFWSIVCGVDIPINCQISGGLLLPHPNGVVIHPDAIIGANCLIFQQVTIGTIEITGTPQIGNFVDIGAGAKVLGDITIGDHARIGANSVVLSDVPAYATAVGAPARIIKKNN